MFQINNRVKMLGVSIIAAVFYFIHFVLLGALTGAGMNLVHIVRSLIYMNEKKWARNKGWIIIFIALIWIITYRIADSYIDLLPAIALTNGSIAFWLKNEKHIRYLMLIGRPLWFTYNLVNGSIPGVIVEVFILASNLIGIYRFDIKGKISIPFFNIN